MKRILLFTVMCVGLCGVIYAQAPDSLWSRTYGTNREEYGRDFILREDGDLIIGGNQQSPGGNNMDFWMVHTDSSGNHICDRRFGTDPFHDECYSIIEACDGGYLMVGWTGNFGAVARDGYVIKVDDNCDSLWSMRYDNGAGEEFVGVDRTDDCGFILCGYTGSETAGGLDYWLVKIDSVGNEEWRRTYGGINTDACNSVRQTIDGGYILAGNSSSFGQGDADMWLLRINESGDSLWSKTFGGSTQDLCLAFEETSDGYVLAGTTTSFAIGAVDGWVVRTDENGDSLCSGVFGGIGDDGFTTVRQTQDGGFILGGNTSVVHDAPSDVWLVKTDANCLGQWSQTFGGDTSDGTGAVRIASEGGYIVVGGTASYGAGGNDLWLVKTTPDTLQVCSPDGGEEWSIFQDDTVRWSAGNLAGGVRIELNREYPVGVWEMLTDSTENDGWEAFYITPPLSDNCRVRISSLDGNYTDISDSNFSIVSSEGYLALVRPDEPNVLIEMWDFGVVECPDTVTETFRIKNFGNNEMVVFAPEPLSGSDFSISHGCPAFFALAPDSISACTLAIMYQPSTDGMHLDTLRILSDAVNADSVDGYVHIPLVGERISTPASPEVVILIEGEDARLSWAVVDTSIGGCAITVDRYLVYYSPTSEGQYYYHGYTSDTNYVHLGVVTYEESQFYEVEAWVGPAEILDALPDGDRAVTRDEVRRMLGQPSGVSREE